jgi:hypothetical protein
MIAESPKQFTGIKYSGADWLKKGIQPLPPLATRISNVLGQVFSGIYHLNATGTQTAKLRSPAKEYTLCLFGGMATTDFDTLTRLLLCCQAANLNVSIAGSRKGSLRFTFKNSDRPLTPTIESHEIPDFEALADLEAEHWRQMLTYPLRGGLSSKSRFLTVSWNPSKDYAVNAFSMKSEAIDMDRLQEIVSRAHSACCRAEIEGRCPTGNGQIRLYWTTRSRTATTIMKGHPTPAQAIETLRPFWDIDYTRTD